MNFFGAVVDTLLCKSRVGILLRSNHIPAACFATRAGEMEDRLGEGGREGGRKRCRAEEMSQGTKEGGNQAGQMKEEMVGPSLLY